MLIIDFWLPFLKKDITKIYYLYIKKNIFIKDIVFILLFFLIYINWIESIIIITIYFVQSNCIVVDKEEAKIREKYYTYSWDINDEIALVYV